MELDCFLPDRALSKYEQIAVGITSAGAGRGIFRPAKLLLDGLHIFLKAQTDVIAGGNWKEIAHFSISDVAYIKEEKISLKSQMKGVLAKSIVSFIMIFMFFFFAVSLKLNTGIAPFIKFGLNVGWWDASLLDFEKIKKLIGYGLLFSSVFTFVLFFLPACAKIKENLIFFSITNKKNEQIRVFIGYQNSIILKRYLSERSVVEDYPTAGSKSKTTPTSNSVAGNSSEAPPMSDAEVAHKLNNLRMGEKIRIKNCVITKRINEKIGIEYFQDEYNDFFYTIDEVLDRVNKQ